MENYTVHDVEYDGINYYCVYENATEQVIDFFYLESEAEKCESFLNNGGAFSGFTPSFVLRKIVVQEEINSKFAIL